LSERQAQQASVADGGVSIFGADGYKYFGAAKNLPKVREMLQKEVPIQAPKASLKEMSKNLDAEYLGLSTDAELEEIEALAEAELRSDEAAIEL